MSVLERNLEHQVLGSFNATLYLFVAKTLVCQFSKHDNADILAKAELAFPEAQSWLIPIHCHTWPTRQVCKCSTL